MALPAEKLPEITLRSSWKDYVAIARPDHWIKNIFVLPGMVMVPFFFEISLNSQLIINIALSLIATCFVASSNYVLNEILDRKRDRRHPVKKARPLAAGLISVKVAYIEWIALGLSGLSIAYSVSLYVGNTCLFLWVMGCIYNIPPIRSKELPFFDVLSEAINNPIRMAIGWYAMGITALPPVSALFCYWMLGAFLMGTKRFAEYRRIGNKRVAALYRRSFHYYTEDRLLAANVFYLALFMTGAMAFVMLYRLELVFAIPFFAYLIAYYFNLGFRENSPAQYPEFLYKEKHLMLALGLCALSCFVLMFFVDIPWFRELFEPLTSCF